MPKFKILLCDDVERQLNLVQTSLVRGGNEDTDHKKRRDAASQLYEIKRFQIGGEAIDALQNWKPDLCIVDIRFEALWQMENIVKNRGYDITTEASPTRGIEVIKAIKEKYPDSSLIAYTAHGIDRDVYAPLKTAGVLNAEYFLPFFQKDDTLDELTENTVAVLARMTAQYQTRVDIDTLRTAYEACDKTESSLLDLRVVTGEDTFEMRHFMAHLATIREDDTLTYPQLIEHIEYLLQNNEEEDLLFEPNGIWQQGWVRQLIKDLKKDTSAPNIDVRATNLMLAVIEGNWNNHILGRINFDIGREPFIYGAPGPSEIFHNALVIRRMLLGFSQLLEMPGLVPIFHAYQYRGQQGLPNSLAFTTIFRFANIGTGGYSNERRVLSKVLGLSLRNGYVHGPQRLNIDANRCLPEELEFLNIWIPKVAERFLAKPAQPHPLNFNRFIPFK